MNLRTVGGRSCWVGGSQALTSRSGLLQAWELGPQAQHARALRCLSPLDVAGTVGPQAWPGSTQAPLWRVGGEEPKESESRSRTLILILPTVKGLQGQLLRGWEWIVRLLSPIPFPW